MQCFNPDSSNSIYCQCRNGEIISSDDLGKSWRYILTKDYLFKSIDVSANFIDDCGIRLWQIGDDLSFTDFIANYKNEIKVLQIEGNELISFDTLDINKSNEKILFLSNNGNAIVRISGAYLKNTYKESNFQIIKQFPDKIKPCEIYDAKVQFNPTSHGFKEDTLVILYNNALDTLTYELTGFGNDTQISVKSSNTNKILLFPNPAENFLIIRGLKEETKCNIKIYSMLGILEKQYNFQSNSLDYILSLEDISAGLKIVKIRHDDIFEIKKIMISK